MTKLIMVTILLTLLLLTVAGCGGATTPLPTLIPPPLVTANPIPAPPPTAIPQPSATQVPPTATAPATATSVPPTAGAAQPTVSPTTSAPSTATPVPVTATTAPANTPASPAAAPGLYVTSIRTDPTDPKHGQAVSFFVTFLNTASTVNNQKWQVYIFKSDNPSRRNNETTVLLTPFTPGSTELQALGTFTYGSTSNVCDYFDAHVVTLDQNNKGIELTKPDGTAFSKPVIICN